MHYGVKYEAQVLGDLSRNDILLYVTIVLDPQHEIDGMVYGLESTNRKAWADHITKRVKQNP